MQCSDDPFPDPSQVRSYCNCSSEHERPQTADLIIARSTGFCILATCGASLDTQPRAQPHLARVMVRVAALQCVARKLEGCNLLATRTACELAVACVARPETITTVSCDTQRFHWLEPQKLNGRNCRLAAGCR
eukprot:scaffold123743_cov57-Phaeocystis_antarctica.AAC.6